MMLTDFVIKVIKNIIFRLKLMNHLVINIYKSTNKNKM